MLGVGDFGHVLTCLRHVRDLLETCFRLERKRSLSASGVISLNWCRVMMTIVVLVLVSTGWGRRRLGAPAALGVPYVREER